MDQKEDYGSFDGEEYIRKKFIPSTATEDRKAISTFLLKHLAEFYKSFDATENSLKVLDYGCGPSLAYSISASPKAAEIVLADYSKSNRNCLQKWVDGDDSLYDWIPQFQYVVQNLEGGTAEQAQQRRRDLRSKVKAIVHCDLLEDEFIDKDYRVEGSYDVIMSFLCIATAVKDLKGYKSGVAKLSSLLKDGGHLLLLSTRQENSNTGFYIFNGIKYSQAALKRDFVIQTLDQAGFRIDSEDFLPLPPSPISNNEGVLFIAACKAKTS